MTTKTYDHEQRQKAATTWLSDRQRGRTDLLFLCREILGYKDFESTVHGPAFAHFQQFRGCEEYIDLESFTLTYSEPFCAWHSIEKCNKHLDNDCAPNCKSRGCKPDCVGRTPWSLDGPRFRMYLDPRGHLKTTGNTIAHSIQWIVNFRDIRIALAVYEGTFGAEVLTEIEGHFRNNERFRFLYPEFCPAPDKAARWGNLESFTVPNRRRRQLKEPTMKVVAKGQAAAGPHYEVIKLCDLVNKENAYTDGGLKETKRHFRFLMPLLERGPKMPNRPLTRGWVDMEGTIYNHSDLYVEQLEKDEERQKKGKSCRWAIFKRDAVTNDRIWEIAINSKISDKERDERLNKFKPEELVNCTLWPTRFPLAELLETYGDMDDFTFNCQYRLNPHSASKGLADPKQVVRQMIPASRKKEMMPRYWIEATVDLAGMEEEGKSAITGESDDNDKSNSAGSVCGHLGGSIHVLDAFVGRLTPFEIIDKIFEWDELYKPQIIKVEKNHHAEVLMPFLKVAMEKAGRWINVKAIPRDSNASKDNRIWGLQPWFRKAWIRFYDDVPNMDHILKEIANFPYFRFKDFVDCLSDQLRNEDGEVDAALMPRDKTNTPTWKDKYGLNGKFKGFDPRTKNEIWSDEAPKENMVDDESMMLGTL